MSCHFTCGVKLTNTKVSYLIEIFTLVNTTMKLPKSERVTKAKLKNIKVLSKTLNISY